MSANRAAGTRTAEVDIGRRYSARGNRPNRGRWIHRWAPEPHMGEVGIFGGVWFPSRRLELYEPDSSLGDLGYQKLWVATPELGVRGGYYPFRFFGVEAETAVMPAKTQGTDAPATAWTVRGQLVGQIGLWSVTPFLLVGTGVMGIASSAPPRALGSEQDVALHFGGGVKVFLNRWIQLRLDIRDVVSNRRGVGEGLASSPEILLGVSVTLGREKKRRARPKSGDRDGDGIRDLEDYCPDVFGVEPRGCPTVCIDDNDADGLPNPEDKCPNDPESRNGFEDTDGCPDEVPPELSQLAGIMVGINFDTDKDTITSGSKSRLDNAVAVMKKYPSLRVEVIGHTDGHGGYRHNMDLSRRRAEAVKRYIVEQGVDTSRIETRGAGPDEPIDSNTTADGRAKNRRIEFRILEDERAAATK